MRRYDIVAGILLILSIVDFALAAPILVQEKHQERVDVANAPRDVTVTTMLRKRWDEELEKLGEEAAQYFKTSGKPIDSSGTHPSSNSAPYPASSTSNPDRSMEPCCSPSSSSSTSMHGLSARGDSCWGSCVEHFFELIKAMAPVDTPRRGGELLPYTWGTRYHALPTTEAPGPQWMSSADQNFDWDSWLNAPDVPQPPSPPRPVMPKEPGQASGHAPGPPPTESVVPPPSPGAESPTEPEQEVVPGPQPSPNPELQLDNQLLSADSDRQPVDLEAAINRAKGKAKELRHISGTARDVGNAAQR